MQLQLKPHGWSCLATSFAMALDISVKLFEHLAGHDGGEIVFPHLPEPQCRRGFHVSEAVLIAMRLGYSATPLELLPVIGATDGSREIVVHYGYQDYDAYNWNVFTGIIHHCTGVIEMRTRLANWHAVAFHRGHIFDPDGRDFAYSREACESRGLFSTRLWRIDKLA